MVAPQDTDVLTAVAAGSILDWVIVLAHGWRYCVRCESLSNLLSNRERWASLLRMKSRVCNSGVSNCARRMRRPQHLCTGPSINSKSLTKAHEHPFSLLATVSFINVGTTCGCHSRSSGLQVLSSTVGTWFTCTVEVRVMGETSRLLLVPRLFKNPNTCAIDSPPYHLLNRKARYTTNSTASPQS
jgi:hypothetical protein